MTDGVRLGFVTAASNTLLEPLAASMLAGLDGVTAHAARFAVAEVSLAPRSQAQLDNAPMLAAARLVAQARPAFIAVCDTGSPWLGLERDEALVEQIQAATDIPACTAMLAFDELFRRTGVRRIGLVTPYLGAVQERILASFSAQGPVCVAERHAGIADSFAFAGVAPQAIAEMAHAVAAERPDAIAILCANMAGAPLARALEQALTIPVYDCVAVVLWRSLLGAGMAPQPLAPWGRLFGDARLQRREDAA